MAKVYKIGTVETLRVKKSGRRFYVNLDADLISCFGIQVGDILVAKIQEARRPGIQGSQEFAVSKDFPPKKESGRGE